MCQLFKAHLEKCPPRRRHPLLPPLPRLRGFCGFFTLCCLCHKGNNGFLLSSLVDGFQKFQNEKLNSLFFSHSTGRCSVKKCDRSFTRSFYWSLVCVSAIFERIRVLSNVIWLEKEDLGTSNASLHRIWVSWNEFFKFFHLFFTMWRANVCRPSWIA